MPATRNLAFLPVGLLLFAAGFGTVMIPGRDTASPTSMSKTSAPAIVIAAEAALAETEALNCPRPAHTLSLLGKALRSECRRSPDHTVTLDQESVERLYRLANRASEDEKQRR